MQIYNVYQSGKRLYIDEKENPDNKIVVNKYDNMQQTLRLVSDGTLPPRLYWALRNPKLSQKYFILKLVNNEDLIVGTDISATPGLWDMLLIGTDEDYIIEGADIDQSRLTYVSDHFGRLFVRDNFLEELDFEEQCSPTFRVFYDEIMFQLDNIPDLGDIPDKMSDLENDTNFISGVAFKDDGEGNVNIIGTTFSGGETEEGGGGSGGNIEVDDKLDEESTNPVQNKVVAKEVNSLKEKDESLDKEVKALEERNAKLEETVEKLQIKTTTSPSPFHHITDSANMKVLDFGMEGITEQYTGTITDDEGNEVTVPNPTHPQEIKLAGVYNEATGRYEIGMWVYTTNRFDINRALNENEYVLMDFSNMGIGNKQYVVPFKLKPNTSYRIETTRNNPKANLRVYNNKTYVSLLNNDGGSLVTNEDGVLYIGFYAATLNEQMLLFGGTQYTNIRLYESSMEMLYSESKEQRITLTSPVPLTKWDKLVNRDGVWGWSIQSKEYNLSGDEVSMDGNNADGTKVRLYVSNAEAYINSECYCNMIRKANYASIGYCGYWFDGRFCIIALNSWLEPYGYTYDESSNNNATNAIAAFKAMLNDNPIQIWVDMQEERAFHPLPDEEQELLNNLEMYYGVTNLYNDQGCPMWLCYTCDSKLYVDQKLEQINNALLSLGANV